MKGWTMKQSAHISGLHEGSISAWERGLRHPSSVSLAKAAKALGLSLRYLYLYGNLSPEAAAELQVLRASRGLRQVDLAALW